MVKRWLPLLIVVVLLLGGLTSGVHEKLSLTNLIQQREFLSNFVADNLIIALGAYMLLYIVLTAVSFPGGLALSITSGFIFGWLTAGIATVTAATIGATIIFLIARSSFGAFLQNKAGGFVANMAKGFQKDAFQYLFTLRLIPAFPFWVVNIVPGLLQMKLMPYVLATFFGILPGTFVFTYLGAGLDSVITQQEKANPGCVDAGTCTIDPKALVTTDIVIALVALAFLSFLPFLVKRFTGAKTAAESID